MSLIEQLSAALSPHTRHLADTASAHLTNITGLLREIRQQSDLGRADTGDTFKFIIRNGQINVTERLEGPTLGEIWSVQSICVNGHTKKSPGFTVRTNTGRLIFACLPESMGNEGVGGDVVMLQGEELIFEPEAAGQFDFTIGVLLRKYPRQQPDAGAGVSESAYENRFRGEHEPERVLPAFLYGAQGGFEAEGTGEVQGDVSPDVIADPYGMEPGGSVQTTDR